MEEEPPVDYVERFIAPWHEIDLDDATVIIEQTKEYFQMGVDVLEIVYEPLRDTQWAFRVIAAQERADEITKFVADALVEVMPQVNPDDEREWTFEEKIEYYLSYYKPKKDEVVRSNPETVKLAALRFFGGNPPFDTAEAREHLDEIRYPDLIRSYPYRAVWKDMFSVDMPTYMHPLTTHNLLGEADPWEGGAEIFIADFGKMTGCEVVNNMSANMLYLGSQSKERLEAALRYLRRILVHKLRASPSDVHILCTGSDKSYFTMTRGNGALKLFRSTILVDQPATYVDVFKRGEHICLSPDQKIKRLYCPPIKAPMPIETRPPIDNTPWSVWVGYRCPEKQPCPLVEDLICLDLDDGSRGAWSADGAGSSTQIEPVVMDLEDLDANNSKRPLAIVDETTEPGTLPLRRLLRPLTWPSSLVTKICAGRKSRDEYIVALCAATKHLMAGLVCSNDRVSLKASFGRIVLNNTYEIARRNKALDHFNYDEDKLLEGLNTYYPSHEGRFLFTPVISLFGSDAALMITFVSRKGKRMWRDNPASTSVWYEFKFHDSARPEFDCIIAINAETFDVEYREADSEYGRILVHHPQNPWDFVVATTRANAAKVKAAFDADHKVGKCLAQTLTIKYDDKGQMVLTAELPRASTKSLQNIKIRHVAKYYSATSGGTCLNIEMVDAMMVDRRNMPRLTAVRLPPGMHHGVPARWYEANINSVYAEEMFAKNATLKIGDAPAWTMAEMEKRQVFMDLTQHAINMMPGMAAVGCHNDNGLSAAWKLPGEEPEPDGFW